MVNKNVKKLLSYCLALAMLCSLVVSAVPGEAAAKKAKLAKKSLTIVKGASKTIKIKNKKKKAKYKFKASNKKITVNKSGKVKALKTGSAKVTVKEVYKKKTRKIGTVKITVTKKKPSNTSSTNVTPTPTNAGGTTPTPTNGGDTGDNSTPTPTPTATPGLTDTVIYENFFEDGDTNGFTARGSGAASIEISNSENHTLGGMNALHVIGRDATWNGAQLSITELVQVGNTYKFSAWVKQDSGSTESIAMKLQYKDLGGTDQYKSVVAGSDNGKDCPSGQWVELSGEYEIPEYDGDISLYFEVPTSETVDFLVDDVVITGKPVVASNDFQATETVMKKMAQASLCSAGNNARIKSVISKARAGETVSLAYIGGSVTEGALVDSDTKCYAKVSADAFAETYGTNGGSNVHFINAGMSGTPSDIGVVRYNRDVIDRLPEGQDHPDILFIEFAVNDFGCDTAGGAYEGLIREALSSGSAVVLIFSVFKPKNTVCEPDYRRYGKHYDLPMVSMGDAINDYYNKDGFAKWYFGDNLHPNARGYQLMSDCIMNMMDVLDKEEAEEDNITDVDSITPLKTAAYQGIKMIDQSTVLGGDAAITNIAAGGFTGKDTATGNFQYTYNGKKNESWFPNNWMHTSSSGADSLKISVNCSTLMLVYKLSNQTSYGSADLYIDGVKKTTLNCFDSSGWNNGKVYLALTENEAAAHEIELKMADGNESKNFTLLAIGYK